MYEYAVRIKKVKDGDTLVCDVDLGFGVWLNDQVVRLVGVDAPEVRTRVLEEKAFGKYVTKLVKAWVDEGDSFVLNTFKIEGERGSFGRILGEVTRVRKGEESDKLTEYLLDRELVVPYTRDTEARAAAHLVNLHTNYGFILG